MEISPLIDKYTLTPLISVLRKTMALYLWTHS